MSNAMRILFISGDVAPFTGQSEIANLVRTLPEQLCETGDYETRIMMPRYGVISERKNRLHEVIRLSGTSIQMGDAKEVLKVKVASIPGIRLQVYFMDNNFFFKRKGIFADRAGKLFEDNPERAIFFGRGVLETIKKLGWRPDVIHALGWMSGIVPLLLRTDYAEDPLFASSKCVYTPESVSFDAPLSAEQVQLYNLLDAPDVVDHDPTQIGASYADAVIAPEGMDTSHAFAAQFGEETATNAERATEIYDQVLNGVPV